MSRQHKKTRVRRSALPAILLAAVVIGILLICLLPKGSARERIANNKLMQQYVLEQCDEWDHMVTVTVTDQISRDTKKGQVTYDVSVYQVAEGIEVTDALWKLKSNAAARHEALNKIGVASITLDMETGNILNFQNEPAGQ